MYEVEDAVEDGRLLEAFAVGTAVGVSHSLVVSEGPAEPSIFLHCFRLEDRFQRERSQHPNV